MYSFAEVTDSIQKKSCPFIKKTAIKKEDWISYCKKINEVGKRLEDEQMPLLIITTWEQ